MMFKIRGLRALVQILYLADLYDVMGLARLAAQTFLGWVHYHSWLVIGGGLILLGTRLLYLG